MAVKDPRESKDVWGEMNRGRAHRRPQCFSQAGVQNVRGRALKQRQKVGARLREAS